MTTYTYTAGQTVSTVEQSSGDDIWNIEGVSGNVVTFSMNNFLPSSGGNDTLNGEYLTYKTITMGSGNDVIYLSNTTGTGSVNAANGDDTITLIDSDVQLVYGGNGNDIVTLDGTTTSTINMGAGDDVVYVSNGSDTGQIRTNSGTNEIHISSGATVSSIGVSGTAGSPQIITIDDATVSTDIAMSNTAADITITNSTVGTNAARDLISVGNADSTITISNSTINADIRGGTGTLAGDLNLGISNTVMTGEIYTGRGDDTITLSNVTIGGGGLNTSSWISSEGDDTFYLHDISFTGTALVEGGNGADIFYIRGIEGTDYTIQGGEDGSSDVIHLVGNTSDYQIFDASGGTLDSGEEDGYILYDDNGVTRRIDFTGIETVDITPPCFTTGTKIMTQNGEVNVEDLEVSDIVCTMDRGNQEIRWIGKTTVPAVNSQAPIMIKNGALGNRRDLLVSPQHRMLITHWKAEVLFEQSEVLVAAKHLINGDTIYCQAGAEITYFHIMFDRHEIIFAEGAPTESFFAGELARNYWEKEVLDEICGLFPELRHTNEGYCATVRRSLTGPEAKIIAKLI